MSVSAAVQLLSSVSISLIDPVSDTLGKRGTTIPGRESGIGIIDSRRRPSRGYWSTDRLTEFVSSRLGESLSGLPSNSITVQSGVLVFRRDELNRTTVRRAGRCKDTGPHIKHPIIGTDQTLSGEKPRRLALVWNGSRYRDWNEVCRPKDYYWLFQDGFGDGCSDMHFLGWYLILQLAQFR